MHRCVDVNKKFHKHKVISFGFLVWSCCLLIIGLVAWFLIPPISQIDEPFKVDTWRWKLKEFGTSRLKEVYIFDCNDMLVDDSKNCTKVGPFKFEEMWSLMSVIWSKSGVQYARKRTWRFIQNGSVDLNKEITTINIPLMRSLAHLDPSNDQDMPNLRQVLIKRRYSFYATMTAEKWLEDHFDYLNAKFLKPWAASLPSLSRFNSFISRNGTIDGIWMLNSFDHVKMWRDLDGSRIELRMPETFFLGHYPLFKFEPDICRILCLQPTDVIHDDVYDMDIVTYTVESTMDYIRKIKRNKDDCTSVQSPFIFSAADLGLSYAHADLVTGLVLHSNFAYQWDVDSWFVNQDTILRQSKLPFMIQIDSTKLNDDIIKLLAAHHKGNWLVQKLIRNVCVVLGSIFLCIYLVSIVFDKYFSKTGQDKPNQALSPTIHLD